MSGAPNSGALTHLQASLSPSGDPRELVCHPRRVVHTRGTAGSCLPFEWPCGGGPASRGLCSPPSPGAWVTDEGPGSREVRERTLVWATPSGTEGLEAKRGSGQRGKHRGRPSGWGRPAWPGCEGRAGRTRWGHKGKMGAAWRALRVVRSPQNGLGARCSANRSQDGPRPGRRGRAGRCRPGPRPGGPEGGTGAALALWGRAAHQGCPGSHTAQPAGSLSVDRRWGLDLETENRSR